MLYPGTTLPVPKIHLLLIHTKYGIFDFTAYFWFTFSDIVIQLEKKSK